MSKLGKLKEKSFPKHGKVLQADEMSKFTQMPKGARGEEPAERGKFSRPDDHEMSVNQVDGMAHMYAAGLNPKSSAKHDGEQEESSYNDENVDGMLPRNPLGKGKKR